MTTQIIVSNITGDLITVNVNNSQTIKELKDEIAKKLGNCKHYYFSLIFNNNELDDNALCSTLKNNSKLFYIMHLNLQREILFEIKKKMQLNVNWDRNISFDDWNNIRFGDYYHHYLNRYFPNLNPIPSVRILELHNLQLTCNIPTEIGELVSLNRLELFNTNISAVIPTEIGKLVNLETLSLDNNKLIGKIPTEIGKLVNLLALYLDNNKLTGKIPTEIGRLVCLRRLIMNSNKLTGKIPTEIGKLVNLKRIFTHNNKLIGNIPTEIGKLVNLEYLYLHNNKLMGKIPTEIKKLNIKNLNLSNNRLLHNFNNITLSTINISMKILSNLSKNI
jgi:Leucine-rich repeat (LRR) protein